MVFLTVDDVKNICFEYAKAHLAFDEPLPDFDTRYVDQLETALFAPQKSFGGKMMHPDISSQAAVLFYEMIMLHPFMNGNKRMACISMMTFLGMNDRWIETSWHELYDTAITVAKSHTTNREDILSQLKSFVDQSIVSSKL